MNKKWEREGKPMPPEIHSILQPKGGRGKISSLQKKHTRKGAYTAKLRATGRRGRKRR